MAYGNEKRQHYGPEPHYGMGAEMVDHMIHERAIGKTIAAVYLGDERLDEPYEPGGNDRTEHLLFEFTDGTTLTLLIGSGNSFFVTDKRPG
jgi:hypothetical protein